MLFKRHLLTLVLQGRKTQTRRLHKHRLKEGRTYPITDRWYSKPAAHIKILKVYQQRLGDITETEAKAEGFNTIEEFKQAWTQINGSWQPETTVTVYEFQLSP
jgi:hypothetical protein